MPLAAGCLNFCWEVNAAVASYGLWGHILWLVLDIVILFQNMRYVHWRFQRKGVLLYTFALVLIGCLFAVLFRVPDLDGMLYTVFTVDLIMAAEYVAAAKQISPNCKVPIAICKLLGDLFAWIAYFRTSTFVAVAGGIVLALNIFYLCWCIEEREQTRKKVRKH